MSEEEEAIREEEAHLGKAIGDAISIVREANTNYDLNLDRALTKRLAESLLPNPSIGTTIDLSVFIDPGDADPETIAEVLVALSNLHAAYGGSGLQFSFEGLTGEVIAHESSW